ncbi:DUF3953 domain-containing protein [Clostridium sp. MT-14]|jgi:hypothetical protein|uniref:DUF3953 domain-containing protein n=1 Tax=unclassified Clostridium TaxID=2614128 RepID=UPI00123A41E7|nr:DUF3953 domain-containing protein [Clostridium sp. HV4-5-A1G]KAA8662879.1 DUF3953 domain-containing protein [Clostridium sp. HV4-5-A1G]CAB1262788.1 conserved membrane hypothetical protein [Clostridiaceae bacterium BL-3]
MNLKIKKKPQITIAIIIVSAFTVLFALLSIKNSSNYLLRILTQGSLCLTMLLSGINYFIYKKQKALGILLWLVSAFGLFVTIHTIITSFTFLY